MSPERFQRFWEDRGAEHYWEAEVADVEEATIKLVASRMAGGVSGVGVALPAGSVLPPAPPALDVPAAC